MPIIIPHLDDACPPLICSQGTSRPEVGDGKKAESDGDNAQAWTRGLTGTLGVDMSSSAAAAGVTPAIGATFREYPLAMRHDSTLSATASAHDNMANSEGSVGHVCIRGSPSLKGLG